MPVSHREPSSRSRSPLRSKSLAVPFLLEHVNLEIPSPDAAKAFYVDRLGGQLNVAACNNKRQVHVNFGASQLHLLYKRDTREIEWVTVPQVWQGQLSLWTDEDLEVVAERCGCKVSNGSLEISCPWGNRYVLQPAPLGFKPPAHHSSGTGRVLAMHLLTHAIPRGMAATVQRFYHRILGIEATLEDNCCIVPFRLFGVDQRLEYYEQDGAIVDGYDKGAAHEYHICLYLDFDNFAEAFCRAEAAGLIFVNPRYVGNPLAFGSAVTLQEAKECGQFRVKDMKDPETGIVGLVLEHEVRSPGHMRCPWRVQQDGSGT